MAQKCQHAQRLHNNLHFAICSITYKKIAVSKYISELDVVHNDDTMQSKKSIRAKTRNGMLRCSSAAVTGTETYC